MPFTFLIPMVALLFGALLTKKFIPSLILGIYVATYLVQGNHYFFNSFKYILKIFISVITDLNTIIPLCFLVLFGIFIELINQARMLRRYQNLIEEKIQNLRQLQKITLIISPLFFIDDYFASFTIKALIKPLTHKFRLPKSLLAFLIDSTVSSWSALIPFSSWGVMIIGQLTHAFGKSNNNISAIKILFCSVPFFVFPIITILIAWYVVHYGTWKPDLFYNEYDYSIEKKQHNISYIVALIPFITLGCIIGFNFYETLSLSRYNFTEAFKNFNLPLAMLYGACGALLSTILIVYQKSLLSLSNTIAAIGNGIKEMINPILMLTLTWTFVAIIKTLHNNGTAELFSHIPEPILPLLCFVASCMFSIGLGSSWGSIAFGTEFISSLDYHGIMIYPMIGGIISGAIAGAQCSVISDSVLIASTGASCDPVEHFKTQLPYTLRSIVIAFVTFLFTGIVAATTNNYFISCLTAYICLIFLIFIVHKRKSYIISHL